MESSGFDLDSFLQKNKVPLIFSLLGLLLLGLGVLTAKTLLTEEPKMEISGQTEGISAAKILVDLSGAVVKAGVYELESGSRINDLLVAAGGLAAEADREWVAKNLNLAQKVTDGSKIYVPKKGEVGSEKMETGSGLGSGKLEGKININTASLQDLDTLWGVGETTAKKIIENRPYQKSEDLLYKKIVKSNVWEKIKDQVTVY